MPEISGKCKSTQLKPIIWYTSWKLPKKWGNRPKKEETYQQTENLKLFLKAGNLPNKRGNGSKKRGNRPKKRGNWSTNWEFTTFWKPETNPKNEETDSKKEETDQQTENLKLFLKTEYRPKKWGNGPKKKEADHQSENSKLIWKP